MNGILLDLDGTLYVGETPLPGAVETVRGLTERGVPRRYLTNTTRISRAALALRLQRMGFPIEVDEIFTAPRAAAAWLQHADVRRVALYLPEATREDFAALEVVEQRPQAVVVGDLGEGWTFERLNTAFRQLQEGAQLVALQKNRYWLTAEGLSLDAGPFVAALEYATRTEAVVVGKPSRAFFAMAADSLGMDPERITVVGDDVEADVGGALAAGMHGALVRTGKYRPDALERSGVRPDLVAASVVEAVSVLFPG